MLAGVCDTLAGRLDEQGQHQLLAEMELPLARVLADMERIGFAVDAEGIRRFGDTLRGELDGILQRIYAAVGYEFNLNSPQQLGEALFDKLGLPPRRKTKRGYSTDAETLESLRPYSEVVDDILKYRTYAKLLSTYVDGLLKTLGPRRAGPGRPAAPWPAGPAGPAVPAAPPGAGRPAPGSAR